MSRSLSTRDLSLDFSSSPKPRAGISGCSRAARDPTCDCAIRAQGRSNTLDQRPQKRLTHDAVLRNRRDFPAARRATSRASLDEPTGILAARDGHGLRAREARHVNTSGRSDRGRYRALLDGHSELRGNLATAARRARAGNVMTRTDGLCVVNTVSRRRLDCRANGNPAVVSSRMRSRSLRVMTPLICIRSARGRRSNAAHAAVRARPPAVAAARRCRRELPGSRDPRRVRYVGVDSRLDATDGRLPDAHDDIAIERDPSHALRCRPVLECERALRGRSADSPVCLPLRSWR